VLCKSIAIRWEMTGAKLQICSTSLAVHRMGIERLWSDFAQFTRVGLHPIRSQDDLT
jgi:hypothetical protein